MNTSQSHSEGLAVFGLLLQALSRHDAELLRALCDEAVETLSSHRGAGSGRAHLQELFGPCASGEQFSLSASNLYFAGTLHNGRVSSYITGRITGSTHLDFGAVLLMDLGRAASEKDWQIRAIKLQLTWVIGDLSIRTAWRFPDHARIWQTGDPLPVIVSETDAPWHLYPDSQLQGDESTRLADTYARYSWGIDQADFGLLASCYTDDAAGTFRPLGPLSGRHAIVGVLKDFRRAWPMMQHYGEILASTIDGDRAAMIVGRLIPQERHAPGTHGAYYPLRLVRSGAQWKICWTEYRPGWFSPNDIDLTRLLAVTFSGEGDWAE